MTKQSHHKHEEPEVSTQAAPAESAVPATETPVAETAQTGEGTSTPKETAATPPPPAAPAVDQQLAEAMRAALEWRDKCLRTAADFDNYRKRVQRDLADTRVREKIGAVQAFLTVLDHFQMARDHFETNPDVNTMKQGINMIHAEFKNAMSALGVELVNADGAVFNPVLHEAISQEFSDTVPTGTVTRQWKAGYKIGETLLRPASVIVSSGPNPAAAAAEEG